MMQSTVANDPTAPLTLASELSADPIEHDSSKEKDESLEPSSPRLKRSADDLSQSNEQVDSRLGKRVRKVTPPVSNDKVNDEEDFKKENSSSYSSPEQQQQLPQQEEEKVVDESMGISEEAVQETEDILPKKRGSSSEEKTLKKGKTKEELIAIQVNMIDEQLSLLASFQSDQNEFSKTSDSLKKPSGARPSAKKVKSNQRQRKSNPVYDDYELGEDVKIVKKKPLQRDHLVINLNRKTPTQITIQRQKEPNGQNGGAQTTILFTTAMSNCQNK